MKNFFSNGFYEMTRDEIMLTEGGSMVMYTPERAGTGVMHLIGVGY